MISPVLRLAPLCLSLLLAACDDVIHVLPPDATLPDGSQYRGKVVDGLLQGPGRLDYHNGSWFVGQFKDGLFEGAGEWQGSNGEHYLGDFHEGMFHGQGTLTYSDGSHYQGGFERNRFSGEGLLEQGGQRYQGEFLNNRFHGLGKLEVSDGSSFQGQFVAGVPEGQGIRIDTYGDQYSGLFSQGMLNGQGNYTDALGDSYSGDFRNNEFHGKGRYQSADGDVWAGEFIDGIMQGNGTHNSSNGSHYLGGFKGFLYQGEGSLTLADGTRQTGTWQHGRLVRNEQGQILPDNLELGLLQQGRLLDEAIAAIPASTPARELYTLTLAGDGKQSVFMREADYVSRLMRERFGAHGSVTLINHSEHMTDRPLATRENLTRVIQALAERTGEEDLVFIYLTSHGSRRHEISLDQPRLQLANLSANELAELLVPLKNRNKVVVISACYSGGFIPPLKDEKTLVMTAARADRVSFGCNEENDFTYFGRALFAEALGETDNLEHAFELAKERVAEREQSDGFEPSEPQMWAPQGVLQHWRSLRQSQAKRALDLAASPTATN